MNENVIEKILEKVGSSKKKTAYRKPTAKKSESTILLGALL